MPIPREFATLDLKRFLLDSRTVVLPSGIIAPGPFGGNLMKRVMAPAVAGVAAGCSPFMEANRPEPVDLSQFSTGQSHLQIIKVLGPPLTTVKDNGNNCDLYQLYIYGPDGGGKAVIAAGEAVADVFTLGLSEIIFTPTEAVTRNSKYPVAMCYGANDQLVSVEAAKSPVGETGTKSAASTAPSQPAANP